MQSQKIHTHKKHRELNEKLFLPKLIIKRKETSNRTRRYLGHFLDYLPQTPKNKMGKRHLHYKVQFGNRSWTLTEMTCTYRRFAPNLTCRMNTRVACDNEVVNCRKFFLRGSRRDLRNNELANKPRALFIQTALRDEYSDSKDQQVVPNLALPTGSGPL